MSFDIAKIGAGEWFPFQESEVDLETGTIKWSPPDPTSEEKVCFRQVHPDALRAMNDKYRGKKINTPVLNTLSKAMEIVVTYEPTPGQEKDGRIAFWDEAIQNWMIKDKQGADIPGTAENKYLLITGDMRFLRYANRCLQLLSGIVQDTARAAEKN